MAPEEKDSNRTVNVKPGTSLANLRLMAKGSGGIGTGESMQSIGSEAAIEQVAALQPGEPAAAADIMFGPIE